MVAWRVFPHSLILIEAVPVGLGEHVGDKDGGVVELRGFDADPALDEPRESNAVRRLGEAELFGADC